MTRKLKTQPPLTEDEQALWQQYTKTVKRLDKRPVVETVPATLTSTQIMDRRYHYQQIYAPVMPTLPDPRLNDLRSNVSKRDRKAQVIDGRLDLHGLTQAEAYREVTGFIERQYSQGARTLLIITGKGLFWGEEYQRGVLVEALPSWLNQPPLRSYIRTFTHAHYKDGGTGAFYIFLKK
jgi:DNA-nicking Smr family endonuclease